MKRRQKLKIKRVPLQDNKVVFILIVLGLVGVVVFSLLFSTSTPLMKKFFSGQNSSMLTGGAVSSLQHTVGIQTNQANCSALTTAGPYLLTQNVNSVGTCFTITSSNILLDCQGYTINYSTNGLETGYGIFDDDKDNITIRNCRIEEGNATVNAKYGIYLRGNNNPVENVTIWNNTIRTIGDSSYAIRFLGVSNTNTSSNTFDTYGDQGYGISFNSFFSSPSINHRVVGNTLVLRVRPVGVSVASTNNISIEENKINSSGVDAAAVQLSTVTNATVRSNVLNTNGSAAPGIQLSNVKDSWFESNRVVTLGNTAYALYLSAGTINNNLFLNNNLSALKATEIQDDSSTDGTTINYLKYNNSFGEIQWMNNGSGTFLDDLDIEGNIGLGINLFIGDNVAGLNTSNFTSSKINSSANITLKGLGRDILLNITKDSDFKTTATAVSGTNCLTSSPVGCYLKSFSGGVLIFNVTGFSSFSTILNHPPVITSLILNTTDVTKNDTDQNLTVYAVTTDQESNIVKVIYTWYKNNNSVIRINMPFEPDGNQNATDYSGFDNNGTVNGGAFYNSSAIFGTSGSYQFDGVNDYVSITDTYNPINYTIVAWINPSDNTSTNIFVRTDSSGPTTSWSHQLRITATGKVEHYTYDGAGKTVTGTTSLNTNTWYHVAAVAANNGLMKLYVNGVEEGTPVALGTLWTGGDRYDIGSNSGDGMGYFSGNIKNVQVYNYSLPAAQIRALYYNQTTLITNLTAGDGWGVCATANDNVTNGDQVCSNNVTIRTSYDAPPRFDPYPVNQTIDANTTFFYDFNATDDISIVTYGVNDSTFNINSTGGLVNSSPLQFRTYFLNISINDTSNNKNWTFFQVTIQDTIQPRFETFPTNQTIEANTSFSYDFDGIDLVSLVTYGVNTTTFNINNTGGLVNATALLALGIYRFNITINDTSNNKNSTFFQVIVQDTKPPRFDPLPTNQTLEYGDTFVYDINATDLVSQVTFGINSTTFNINSTGGIVNLTPFISLGTYRFNLTINDTSNNKNATFFQIGAQDTIVPRFDPHPVNQTIEANTSVLYDINATDLLFANYSTNYTSLFSINSSGAITNTSAILSLGTYQFNISINDTSNNRNGTFFSITVQDTLPPRFETLPTNQTIEANTTFFYDFEGIDLVSLVTYGVNTTAFNINNTGGLVNSTALLALGIYRFNITINDTSNNRNSTFFQIVVQDTTPPRFDPLPVNQTIEANTTFFYDFNATDLVSLVTFGVNDSAFNINSTGGLVNATPLQFRTYVLNITINDTLNNKNFTYFQITLQDTIPPRFDPLPTNQTIAYGAQFEYDINATDNIALFNFSINYTSLFAINDTGGLRNISSLNVGMYAFNISINDSSNNRNSTFFSLTMQAAPVQSSSSSSGGGGGGSGSSISKKIEEIVPECVDDTGCAPKGFCKDQKCIKYECVENSDCPKEKYCVQHKCYKIFDIKLLQADSPVVAGDSLDFVYFLKGMADISGDVAIQFWLEKLGKKISSGGDTIYMGTYEEKTEQAALFLPSTLTEGEYTLHIELNYKDYIVQSYRTIEIQTQPELVGSVVFANLPAILSSLLKEYTVVLATNKDVPVPATVVHQIKRGEEIIWSKQEEIMINHSQLIKNPVPILEKGVYYFTTQAIIGGKIYKAEQMVTVDTGVQEASEQLATGKVKKAFAGQAIGNAVEVLQDYSVLWFMMLVLVPIVYLFLRSKRQTQTGATEGIRGQTTRAPALRELERWMQTMLVSGAPSEMILQAAREQKSWSVAECTIAFHRALAGHNLKNAYGDFVTEQKLQELTAFIERSLERGMAEERIIAHLVEAEWNSKFISEYVRAYVAQP